MRTVPVAFSLLLLAACADDGADDGAPDTATGDAGTDTAPDGAGDTTDDSGSLEDVAVDAPDVGGARDGSGASDVIDAIDDGRVRPIVDFSVTVEVGDSGRFFDFPYPSDLRLDANGAPDFALFPNPGNKPIVRSLIDSALRTRGFPLLPVAWFRFDGAIEQFDITEIIEMSSDASAFIVVIDPESDHVGQTVPIVIKTLTEDRYVTENVVAIAPVPGFVLEPDTTYAVVITDNALDADGQPLVPDPVFAQLADAADVDAPDPDEVGVLYAPLWPVLDDLGVAIESVVVATVFTTNDPVAELEALGNQALERYQPDIEAVALDPDDGAGHERYCELRATLSVPEFQSGTPPYNSGGVFAFDEAGQLVSDREVTLPVVITLPLSRMPDDGFPLLLYIHGSGGLSEQVVERGPDGTRGQGPAHVVAAYGIAAASTAMPVNPERVPGASEIEYINFNNLAAFPDTFRQGAIEQRLLLSALLALRIDAETVAACEGLSLPEGADAYVFDPASLVAMGQSMGGMYVNLVGPTEPRIRAVVPTGAGGFWSYFILQTDLVPGAARLLKQLLGSGELSFVHPAMQLLQTAWGNAEPMAYVPRLAAAPLEGHPVRSLYVPVGQGDHYFPTPIFDAMALAMENEQAGAEVWGEMQQWLAYRELDGVLDYPVATNRVSRGGEAYTGVVVQYEGDGVHDPHEIFQHDERVKHQYACFLDTFLRTGTGTVVAPAPAGSPCE